MQRPLTGHIRSDAHPLSLAEYEKTGGYDALRKVVGKITPKDVIQEVQNSGLRGRGGAGFPTGLKWTFVPQGENAPRPKYLAINGDEMEPGTFKDRLLLEGNPHLLLEGIILASYAAQLDVAYIFLRWAYKVAFQNLEQAIAEAEAKGYIGENILGSGFSLEVGVHSSAGRYMCGEETGLLNSLEGRRANPRAKPPFPPVVGLWGKPTIVNNVETLCCVPGILSNGVAWFKELSKTTTGGTKIFGVSGKVKKPGLGTAPRHNRARDHRGTRGWHARRPATPRLPARRRLDRLPHGRAPGHRDGLRHRPEGWQPNGNRHDDSPRRQDLSRRDGPQPDEILRTGILWLVHPLPRRPPLDPQDGQRHRRR